jgi:hypothetical protein
MDEVIQFVKNLMASAESFAKRGLFYEAAYRYGQATMVMNTLYLLHSEEVVNLDAVVQSVLARLHQRIAVLSLRLEKAAGNGHHRLGDRNSSARESLLRVVEMLKEDLEVPPWAREL